MHKRRNHILHEFYYRDINSFPGVHRRQAQRTRFAQSFRCYQEDEYDGIAVELLEGNGQSPSEAPIYACKFGEGKQYGHILVLANEDGKLALRNTSDKSSQAAIEGVQIHSNAIYDVCWIPGTSEFVSASGDQTAAILSVREDGSVEEQLVLQGHTRSVKTVHVNPFDPCVIATGGRDGSVIIWDKRCKPHHRADDISPAHHNQVTKTVNSPSTRKVIQNASLANNSVTGVIFQLQHKLISSGASDGLLKVWDLRRTHSGGRRDPQCQNVLEHSGKSSHRGFTCMSISPARDVLYTSCMDNIIYAYHLANPTSKPVAEYIGHVNQTYFVKSCISPCGSYLLSGSSDNNAYMWLTERPGKPIAKLTGHFSEVTSVSWCPVDDEKLVTCADDMKLRVFRRKNVNEDDFEERMNTRGVSELYCPEGGGEVSPEDHSKKQRTFEAKDSVPPLPVTPSTSRGRVSVPATPPREGVNLMSPLSYGSTPKLQTPRHRHKGKGTASQRTPKTSERNTLLQWLASAKTPGSRESSATKSMTFSESKKANMKRKLTEFLKEDRENVAEEKEEEKSVICTSPKKVLGVSTSSNTSDSPHSPPPAVAKMLKYENASESCTSNNDDREEGTTDIEEFVCPLESKDKVALDNGFRKPVTNIVNKNCEAYTSGNNAKIDKPQFTFENKESLHHLNFKHFSSPTANLPNYILDGSSPHNRPETKKEKKRNVDWLTTLSHQRKVSSSVTSSKLVHGALGPFAPKHQKKVLQIKRKQPGTVKT